MEELNPPQPQKEFDLAEAIEHWCSRPKMFFADGSFAIGAAYIEGFVHGRGGLVLQQWGGFRHWLARYANENYGAAWKWAWDCYITQRYPQDEQAFAALPVLFREFLAAPAETVSLVPYPVPLTRVTGLDGRCDTSGGVCVFTFTVANLIYLAALLDGAASEGYTVDFIVGLYTWCIRYGRETSDWSLNDDKITLHTNRVDVAALADDLRGVAEAYQSAPDNAYPHIHLDYMCDFSTPELHDVVFQPE